MADQEERRESSRLNKGKIPARYADGAPAPKPRKKRINPTGSGAHLELVDQVDTSSDDEIQASSYAHRSVSRSSSSRKAQLIASQLQRDEELAKIASEKRRKKVEMEDLDQQAKLAETRFALKLAEMDSCGSDFSDEGSRRSPASLSTRHDNRNKLDLFLEDCSHYSNSDFDPLQPPKLTQLQIKQNTEAAQEEFRLKAQAMTRELVKDDDKNLDDQIAAIKRQMELLETQKKESEARVAADKLKMEQASAKQSEIPQVTPQTTSNTVQQLVQALTIAFPQQTRADPTTTTDKFLARQTHGKDLPFFYGRPEEWITFKLSFENTSAACQYNDVDNLTRLQKCLRGEAQKLVQSLMGTPANVPIIMKKLELRFGQPRHIINTLTEKIKEIPPVKDEKPETLIELGIAVTTLVSTIKALKLDDHLNNPMLLQIVENKLPFTYQLQWGEWTTLVDGREWNLDNFSTWLERKTDTACKLRPPPPPPKAKEDWKAREKPSDQYRNNKRRTEHVCAVEADDGNSNKNNSPATKRKWCALCKVEGHRLQDCRQFPKEKAPARLKIVKENRLCFGCLNFGHSTKDCKSKKTCEIDGCQRKHHRTLHNCYDKESGSKDKEKRPREPEVKPEDDPPEQYHHMRDENEGMHHFDEGQVLYQVLPVTLKGPNGSIDVYAILDGGGAFTLIEDELSKQLGLERKPKPLTFKPIGKEVVEVPSHQVQLEIINPKTGNSYQMDDVRTYKNLSLPCRSLTQRQLNKWEHLKELKLPVYENIQPKILIGIPHATLTAPIRLAKSPPNAPVAYETRLGWIVTGKLPKTQNIPYAESILHSSQVDEDDLHQLVKYHFSTEAFGIKPDVRKPRSPEDKRAEEIMELHLKQQDDGHYETGLLWKKDDVVLPDSRPQALRRLLSLERKLDKDPELAEKYCKKIQYYLDAGYLKKMTPDDFKYNAPRKWYLPHFAVTKESKPGKIRFVLDAAAIANGTSLNANLLKGPDILNPLPAVLCKFRQRRIAITGDIKEMFHQVRMKQEDQHSQRILWRGMNRKSEPEEYMMTVMIFGAACSPYCAQLVKNKNAICWETEYPEASKAIVDRHYVDDYLDSCDTEEEAQQLWEDVVDVHKRGGYHICNFLSNSKELIERISPELRSDSQKDLNIIKEGLWTERVLGMTWDPENDEFTFSINFYGVKPEILSGENIPTKRQALSLIMSIFDPMGFVAHLTIKAKLILQDTWKMKMDWEDKLHPETFEKWKVWLEELMEITSCRIPRCYSPLFSNSMDIQLHIFNDASSQAFASVAYFRVSDGSNIEVSLVMAKSRVVSPKPTTTIPRCELEAAVLGSRLSQAIVKSHEIKPHKIIFWSDSTTVLRWLKMGANKLGIFVENRVGEIQETTDVNSWKYVPTDENVADEATRDNKPCDWSESSRWLNGPSFLHKPETEWPSQDIMKPEVMAILSDPEREKCPIEISRFSNWMRLIRATAYVLQLFNKNWRKQKELFLSPADLKKAECKWWRWVQAEKYATEIKILQQGKPLTKNNPLNKYSPFLDDDGILRMKSRIQPEVEIGDIEPNPVILSSKHPYIILMIRYYHKEAGHHGQEKVVNDIRRKFLIPNLRVAVRKAWNDCQLCKNRRSMPAVPEMAPLPDMRLEKVARPFTNTGLDYFGPMEVTVGRRHEKRYGCLFTCLSTRAVHLEIAASLTTDSCLMAIRRFICRRGKPETIWSDNGTNFVGADNELKKALLELDQQVIQDDLTTRGINWKFIPPSAPHMGGSWERMVKAVKVALAATLKEKAPKEEVLHTLMVEAENCVNGRPLTYVAEDPDSPLAITPNHILLLEGNHLKNQGNFEDADLILRKQWRQAQRLSDIFWKRWLTEYLPTLAKREKWHQQQKPIAIGDVVLLLDSNLPRNTWTMGKVLRIYPGKKDGKIRVVDIKTATGELRRPVAKLCVLDVKRDEAPDPNAEDILPENSSLKQVAIKTKKNRWVIQNPQQQVAA